MAEIGATGRRRARAADPAEELERLAATGQPAPIAQGAPQGGGVAGSAAKGGMVGIGAGMLFGGPVGLGLGALTGILGAIDERREARKLASWESTIADKHEKAQQAMAAVLNDETATQAERDSAIERFRLESEFFGDVLRLGPDQGMGALAGASRADRERQQQIDAEALTMQRQATLEHRKALRSKAEGMFASHNELEQKMSQARILLEDPDFDPDQPQNAAILSGLLEQTQRNMLANPEDMTDAMRGIGGTGALGLLAALGSFFFGSEKAEKMRMSREQWRTLFAANEQVSRQRQANERDALYREAGEHVQHSGRLGLAPDEFTALMSRFAGAEERAAEPIMPARGGFPVGVEGPKGEPKRAVNTGVLQAPAVNRAGLDPVGSARDYLELNRRAFNSWRDRMRQ